MIFSFISLCISFYNLPILKKIIGKKKYLEKSDTGGVATRSNVICKLLKLLAYSVKYDLGCLKKAAVFRLGQNYPAITIFQAFFCSVPIHNQALRTTMYRGFYFCTQLPAGMCLHIQILTSVQLI